MPSVLPIDSVRDSRLFLRLQELSAPDLTASALVANLPDLCQEASDRMKALPAFLPQFTLHDATHLLRVTELMGTGPGATNYRRGLSTRQRLRRRAPRNARHR